MDIKKAKKAVKIVKDGKSNSKEYLESIKFIKEFNNADRIATAILAEAIPDTVSGQIASNSVKTNTLKSSQLCLMETESVTDDDDDDNDEENNEVKYRFYNYLNELEKRYLSLNKMEIIKFKMSIMSSKIKSDENFDDFIEKIRQKVATVNMTGGIITEEEKIYSLCQAFEGQSNLKQIAINIMNNQDITFEEAIKQFRNGYNITSINNNSNDNGNNDISSSNNVVNITKRYNNTNNNNYHKYKRQYHNNSNNKFKNIKFNTFNNNHNKQYNKWEPTSKYNNKLFKSDNRDHNKYNKTNNYINDDSIVISKRKRIHVIINNINKVNEDTNVILDSGAEITVFNKIFNGMTNINQIHNKKITYGNNGFSMINAVARLGKLAEIGICKDLSTNIVSISNLTDIGYTCVITSKGTYIINKNHKIMLDESDIVLTAKRHNGLYTCDVNTFINTMLYENNL
jgi:hypothetical protein